MNDFLPQNSRNFNSSLEAAFTHQGVQYLSQIYVFFFLKMIHLQAEITYFRTMIISLSALYIFDSTLLASSFALLRFAFAIQIFLFFHCMITRIFFLMSLNVSLGILSIFTISFILIHCSGIFFTFSTRYQVREQVKLPLLLGKT